MRLSNLAAAVVMASVALAVGTPTSAPPVGDYGGLDIGSSGKQRRGKGQNNRRGNGLRAKPKKRPNRLTISKRVRRKHRRAAR